MLLGQPQEGVSSPGSTPSIERKWQGQALSGFSPAFRACFLGRRWSLLGESGLDSTAVVLRVWCPHQQHRQHLERPNSQVRPRSTESETLGVGLRMHVSDKFSGDAAGPGTTLWEPLA